jgi:hypothetical protein
MTFVFTTWKRNLSSQLRLSGLAALQASGQAPGQTKPPKVALCSPMWTETTSTSWRAVNGRQWRPQKKRTEAPIYTRARTTPGAFCIRKNWPLTSEALVGSIRALVFGFDIENPLGGGTGGILQTRAVGWVPTLGYLLKYFRDRISDACGNIAWFWAELENKIISPAALFVLPIPLQIDIFVIRGAHLAASII